MNDARQRMNQQQLVESVFALTLEIDEAAELSDWQRAAQLTNDRSPLLHAITAPQDPSALELIRKIQVLDAARLNTATIAQTELSAEYHTAVGNIKAARQYQRVARL
jgi:flagellar protein FliT